MYDINMINQVIMILIATISAIGLVGIGIIIMFYTKYYLFNRKQR